jgi:hypothetical protein
MKPLLAAALLLAISFGTGRPAVACLHFAKDYKDTIVEGKKEALSFHDGRLAHLVLRTQLSAQKELPKEVTWVLPFPSLPKSYQEVDPAVFEELHRVVPMLARVKGGQRGILRGTQSPEAYGGLKIHEAQIVGNYRIEPIEIVSKDPKTGGELNAWLMKRRFNTMPEHLQKLYLKKGAVFLAIRMKLQGSAASVKPLHVTYPSDHVSFPLKFTHDSRTFALDWYVFSRGALPRSPIADNLLRYDNQGRYRPDRAAHPILTGLLGAKQGTIARYSSELLNSEGRWLKDLADDPRFTRAQLGLEQ